MSVSNELFNKMEKVMIPTPAGEVNLKELVPPEPMNTDMYFGVTTNVGSVYTVTTTKVVEDYKPFYVKFNAESSTTSFLTVSSDGYQRKLIKSGGADFYPKVGVYSFIKDGVNFQLLGEGGVIAGTATADKVLKGYTIGTENGIETGTLNVPEEAWWQPYQKWYNCANMESNTFHEDIGSCVCDGKLYYLGKVGGGSDETNITKLLMYDPYTNIWTTETTPPINVQIYSCFCGVFNHKLYWETGYTITGDTISTIYVYDTISKIWTSMNLKLLYNTGYNSRWIMTNDHSFFRTGGNSSTLPLIYDSSTDTVTAKSIQPEVIEYYGFLYHPNKNSIYFFGNNKYSGATRAYVYNCATDSWSQLTSVFTNASWIYFSVIVNNDGNILVGGGSKYSYTFSTSILKYDISLNSYSVHVVPPSQKSCGSIALVKDKLYWYGGYTYNYSYNTNVYLY